MNNQERNTQALIDHIQEQDRIIRRRNEQIKKAEGRAENPRPLTAEDITDEMVLRFMNSYEDQSGRNKPAPTLNHFTALRTSITRNALTAALTPPPTRPEGAEAIEALLDICDDMNRHRKADFLAERGVRVTGESR